MTFQNKSEPVAILVKLQRFTLKFALLADEGSSLNGKMNREKGVSSLPSYLITYDEKVQGWRRVHETVLNAREILFL
jgi:hypothetical protein